MIVATRPSATSHRFSHSSSLAPHRFALAVAGLTALSAISGRADTIVSGSANFNFDPAAWASVAGGSPTPGFEALTLNEIFNKAQSDARTGPQILSDSLGGTPSPTGNLFEINGPTVNNLSLRYSQPTDFAFTPGNLTGHTGAIGLGGVSRWSINPLLGGGALLFGDFALSYDSSRLLVGGTGWQLKANIPPAGVAFDILNVTTSLVGNTLTIKGDLGVSFEVANFLLSNPGDQGRDMGDFTLTATTSGNPVPEPATMGIASGLACIAIALGRRALKAHRQV